MLINRALKVLEVWSSGLDHCMNKFTRQHSQKLKKQSKMYDMKRNVQDNEKNIRDRKEY